MQCPDTAKPPGGVSERTKHTTARTERKRNKEMESNGGDKRQEERTMNVKGGGGETEAGRQTEEKNGVC